MNTMTLFRIVAAIGAPFFGYLSIGIMGHAFTMKHALSICVFLFGFMVMMLALVCIAFASHKFKSSAPTEASSQINKQEQR